MAMAIIYNILAYFRVFLVLTILGIDGIILFGSIFKSKSKTLLIGGGLLSGLLGFLFMLGILSYVLKGYFGILIIFSLFTLICLFLFGRNSDYFTKVFHFSLNFKKINWEHAFYLFLLTGYIILFFLYTRGAPAGGDIVTHWSIAASFARGNYPSVLPWQPQFLTAYHHGGFMVLGALHSLSSTNISITFFFSAFYTIVALFIFITGIARLKKKSFLSLLPAILGIVLFGGVVIYLGDLRELIKLMLSSNFRVMPQFWDFVGGAGTGANSLGFLYYHSHYTFAIGALLLFLFVLLELKVSKDKLLYKYILLIVLLILTLSIMESVFPLGLLPLSIYYIYESRKTKRKVFIRNSLILLVVFLILGALIQNLIRDSFLQKAASEGIGFIKPFGSEFNSRLSYFAFHTSVFEGGKIKWMIPDLRIMLLILLVSGIVARSKWSVVLTLVAIVGIVLGLVVVDPYYRSSALRFVNTSYQFLMFSFGFLLVDLLRKPNLVNRWLVIIFTILLIPQFLTGNAVFANTAIYKDTDNLIRFIDYKNETLDWIKREIPYDKRILFIDEYPFQGFTSSLNSKAVMFYGFFVPAGPLKAKLINYDGALEWFDAITLLEPSALRDLKVDYVFIMDSEVHRFSQKRRDQLSDRTFFNPVYENKTGKLYKVESAFKSSKDIDLTIRSLVARIPDGKSVYLDKFPLPFHDARRGLLVELSKRVKLIGPHWTAAGGAQYLYIAALLPIIETDTPGKEIKDLKTLLVDYVITTLDKNPNSFLSGNFRVAGKNRFVVLWRNIH